MGHDEYVADLAYEFGFPLVVVAANRLGVINHVLQTLITAATFREGLDVAGVVLNEPVPPTDPAVAAQNALEIRRRAVPPLLAEVGWRADRFEPEVDWYAIATQAVARTVSHEDDQP